jgi:hypothetical protein
MTLIFGIGNFWAGRFLNNRRTMEKGQSYWIKVYLLRRKVEEDLTLNFRSRLKRPSWIIFSMDGRKASTLLAV